MKDYVTDKQVRTIYSYKCVYLNNVYPNERIKSRCFCCEYVTQHGTMCHKDCPLYWNDECTAFVCDEFYEHGYYDVITDITRDSYSIQRNTFVTIEEAKRMVRMAYKIAMLDEKENKER